MNRNVQDAYLWWLTGVPPPSERRVRDLVFFSALPSRVYGLLLHAGVNTIDEFCKLPGAWFADQHGIGVTTLYQLCDVCLDHGVAVPAGLERYTSEKLTSPPPPSEDGT